MPCLVVTDGTCCRSGKDNVSARSSAKPAKEYAVGESNQEEFRKLRVRDGQARLRIRSFSVPALCGVCYASRET